MTNLKTIVALFAGVTLSYSASNEISVFDAGNLDSSSPYGLTDNEKTFLKNKQNVENLSRNMGDVESNLNARAPGRFAKCVRWAKFKNI